MFRRLRRRFIDSSDDLRTVHNQCIDGSVKSLQPSLQDLLGDRGFLLFHGRVLSNQYGGFFHRGFCCSNRLLQCHSIFLFIGPLITRYGNRVARHELSINSLQWKFVAMEV